MLNNRCALRLYALASTVAIAILSTAVPALAQYRPRPLNDPATGEKFHIEFGAAYWFPKADITVSSTGLGISGDSINAKRDLGLTDQRFPELQLTLRPAASQKFRLQY